ncbi:hypothetical protein STENM223S_08277 [Streptomyces tendae]
MLLRDDQRVLIDALQQLPARQREALVLRHWLGLKEAEIAAAMGISRGSVDAHLTRHRRADPGHGGPAMKHQDATPSRGTGQDRTGHERPGPSSPRTAPPGGRGAHRTALADALHALAGGVLPDPDAYRTARGEWLRRERRRRLVLTVLVAVVFTLATLIGLWVLNRTPAEPGVIYSGLGAAAADGPSLPRPPG